MKIENRIKNAVAEAVGKLYDVDIKSGSVQLSLTRKDQKGDFTIVVFPLLRFSKKNPAPGDWGSSANLTCPY